MFTFTKDALHSCHNKKKIYVKFHKSKEKQKNKEKISKTCDK